MAGNVPDWRHNAKGAHYYVDEMADVERRLNVLLAQAQSLRGSGGDITGLIGEIAGSITRFGELASEANRERELLDQWIASETRGLLRQAFAGQYKAQFAEQYEIYRLVIEGGIQSIQHFNAQLAALGSGGR